MKGSIPVINPDDVQSPYEHGQWMIQGLVALALVYCAFLGALAYIQAANDARKADKARRRR